MDTGKRNRMFKYMIIAHIATMVLYIPATGAGYRNNIPYEILCAAVTVLEIYLCWKDERHEMFWLIYMGVLFFGLASLHYNHFYLDHFMEELEYIALFLGAPVYMAFGIIGRRISAFLLVEAVAIILLGYLLFITVKRLKNKRSVKL